MANRCMPTRVARTACGLISRQRRALRRLRACWLIGALWTTAKSQKGDELTDKRVGEVWHGSSRMSLRRYSDENNLRPVAVAARVSACVTMSHECVWC